MFRRDVHFDCRSTNAGPDPEHRLNTRPRTADPCEVLDPQLLSSRVFVSLHGHRATRLRVCPQERKPCLPRHPQHIARWEWASLR